MINISEKRASEIMNEIVATYPDGRALEILSSMCEDSLNHTDKTTDVADRENLCSLLGGFLERIDKFPKVEGGEFAAQYLKPPEPSEVKVHVEDIWPEEKEGDDSEIEKSIRNLYETLTSSQS